MKLNVTDGAISTIKDIQKSNNEDVKSVRIHIAGFGWGGPSLGLVLDEQTDNDEVFDIDGISFLVANDLNQFEGFEVDYSTAFMRKGFIITPMAFEGGSC